MDHKNAAGRNWTRETRKQRRVALRRHSEPEAVLAVLPSVRDQLAANRDVAGRNWSRKQREPRRVRLSPMDLRPSYPERERGGGDHDQPYEYRVPSWRWTFPFSERQYARLLALRVRVRDAQVGQLPRSSVSRLEPKGQPGNQQRDLVRQRR
jgi:hypothetical protein